MNCSNQTGKKENTHREGEEERRSYLGMSETKEQLSENITVRN